MKVLHVSTPHSWRGGEQQAAYLMTALHEQSIDQVLICPEDAPLISKISLPAIKAFPFKKRGLLDTQVAGKIRSVVALEKPDLIHCHDSHAHSAAVIASSLMGVRIPVIISRRVDFPVSSNPFSRWKYNHPAVSKIICVSAAIARITSPSIRDKTKLAVVHSGIDLSPYPVAVDHTLLRNELHLAGDTPIVGNLSALADHKDYPTFVRTAAIVIQKNPSIHFIIAGEGAEEKKIRDLINELQISSNVHLLGFRKDFRAVLQSLDLFLITSVTEGLGTIVLDAFAAGIPVVATRAGGIPEMVEDGVTGLIADIGDAAGLSKAVLRLLEHPELKSEIIANAATRVRDFSFRSTADKTLHLYRMVLQHN